MDMKKLFLHFGPGAHPQIDKYFINNDSVTYLQQPYYTGEGEYLPRVIEDTRIHLEKAIQAEEELAVIAHSFGAFLLNQLPQEIINQIDHVTFIAPSFNFFHSLTNLIRYAVKHKASALKDDFEKLLKVQSPDLFWSVFGEFAKIYPDYLALYFYHSENFEKYGEVATKFPAIDEASLVQGVNEAITHYNTWPPQLKKYQNVRLYLGKYDPLISEFDQNFLKEYFGKDNMILVDSGHFPHIEEQITF